MRLLSVIGALAIIAIVAGAFYAFGGYYNVAATDSEPGAIDWALQRIRIASIEKHATAEPPLSLDDPAVIREGARAFATRGCVTCHGGPGADWAKFSEGMQPGPPDLKDVAKERTAEQIFWVVKNGIKMTGMPSFGAIKTPDRELWTIAAFVKKLPTVTPENFKAWSQPSPAAQNP
jgi:mono/diheme cytochrome c family protein